MCRGDHKCHFTWTVGIILSVCFFVPPASAQIHRIPINAQNKIDKFINRHFLPQAQISSLGLSIVRNNGEILYTTGYGLANHEKKIPVGNQTQFLVGSITKSLTSVVVVRVLNQKFPDMGEAVLDTPIMKLIPAANFALVDRYRSEQTTFRDLLAHRTCIFDDNLQVAEPFSTSSELYYRQRYSKELCAFRSQQHYSNPMYVVAGELISILANTTYTELVNHLLQEIGMHNSSLTEKTDDFSNMPFRAQPYYVFNKTSYSVNPELIKRVVINNAAGGLFSTPIDMTKYMRFLLNKGTVKGKEIVPSDVMGWITKPSIYFPSDLKFKTSDTDLVGKEYAYGLGLVLGEYDGWQQVLHRGYFPPYTSLMTLFPGQDLGIFTSVNEGPVLVTAEILHTFIFNILRGTEGAKATEMALSTMKIEEKARVVKNRLTDALYKRFLETNTKTARISKTYDVVGTYGSGSSGEVTITKEVKPQRQTNSTDLYLSYGKWYHGWLENIGDSLYYVHWNNNVMDSDYFSVGRKWAYDFVRVENGRLDFVVPVPGGGEQSIGPFMLGVTLTRLPNLLYSADSCGETLSEKNLNSLLRSG